MHRKQYKNDHLNMCNMTSSISILQFLLKNSSRLIACNLKANIHRVVISNTRAHENRWNIAENSNAKTSMNLWKWRNRAIGMHSELCRQQDVARQFNAHLLTFSRLLNRFRVTRQVNTRQRYRRQLKTTVYQNHFIFTTWRRNSFMSATKVANELH
jgi:hypothetical protein